jgi:hypothetical protein
MAMFAALDALTAPLPTERQWIIRAAAELLCKDCYLAHIELTPRAAKMAAILAAGQLATEAPGYLADLTPMGWTRLAVDIQLCAQWAKDERWAF